MSTRPRPVVLTILDGWGHRDSPESNAIAAAKTPHWDDLCARFAHGLVDTSGISVGLPGGQMGNSEVGHLNLGAGRVIYQDITRVDQAIADRSFFANPVLAGAVDQAKAHDGTVHILGLLSPGGVHSHENHIFSMVRLAAERGAKAIVVHAILDGRDMPPRSAGPSLERLEAVCAEVGNARIGSLIGRYYAMDRDQRWDRVRAAYELLTEGKAAFSADSAAAGLAAAYARDEGDEFVQATAIAPAAPVIDGDAVVFMNFRADRAREITRAFIEDDFPGWERAARPRLASFTSLTQYQDDFGIPVAYPPERPRNTLGEFLSDQGLKQLRIAETEKYAHVTFFFNGGEEAPFPGEDRILVPSPKVRTYDLQPEMSAPEVTDKLVAAIQAGTYDVIICNYANADMVGHTGDFDAAVKAVETLDACMGRLADAVTSSGGEMLVTADHGNVEQMFDPATGQAHTAHTTNLVPLLYVGRPATVENGGSLADIAPTLLAIMGLTPPAEMTGHSLLEIQR